MANSNDFETELPSDQPERRTPVWRSPRKATKRSASGAALFGSQPANGTQEAETESAAIAQPVPSHNETFSVDYNPDPDLQADNEDIESYPLSRTQLNGPQLDPQLNGSSRTSLAGPGAAGLNSVSPPSASKSVVQERYQRQPAINPIKVAQAPISVVAIAGVIVVVIGFTLGSFWLTLVGSLVALVVSLRLMAPILQEAIADLSQQQRALIVAVPGLLFGLVGLVYTSGISRPIARWGSGLRWDIISALGDFLGAIGQIFIAVLAVYVAWRQYIISRDLTVQQNLITQQQTIDSYFQGISELVLDDEGLLEDWPQERVIAEARTAAILSSVDAGGKAKVLRFLSRSKLLTPLARDQRLGRPILDGLGGYAEDRLSGTRVVDLGVMLAASQLASTDLRWLDLSGANLIRADLTDCDLVRTNFARAILCDANLTNTDIMGVRLFYGDLETATPRTRQDTANYTTGEFTGAVIEGADLTNVQRLSETQRRYCCAWGGSKTRATIPGGCEGIPNRLGR